MGPAPAPGSTQAEPAPFTACLQIEVTEVSTARESSSQAPLVMGLCQPPESSSGCRLRLTERNEDGRRNSEESLQTVPCNPGDDSSAPAPQRACWQDSGGGTPLYPLRTSVLAWAIPAEHTHSSSLHM